MAAIVFNNDAQGCYNQIIPSLTMIGSAKFGIPEKPIQSFLEMLENMKYRIRMAHKISETFYWNLLAWVL